jgi:PAS domain S-box-containing protein
MQPLPPQGENSLIDAVRAGQNSGQVHYGYRREYIFASATLPEMGWKVVRAIPAEHIQRPVTRLTQELSFFAALLALLASLLLFILLQRMLSPLGKATASINAMSVGQRSFAPLSQDSEDEVGQLVGAFNRLFKAHEEQRQRLLLATSGTGIGIWDYHVDTGRLIWDDNMFALYGIRAKDFRGAYAVWEEGVHPEDLAEARSQLERAVNGEGDFDTEFRVVQPSGEVRWIKANGAVLQNADGKVVRVLGTNWDITERKRAELMKSQFISTVSHELRTPLTSIRGGLGLACGGQLGDIPEQAIPILQIALRNSEHLTALVNDLLDMEKLSSGEMKFDVQQQPLWPLVEGAVTDSQAYAAQHQINLQLLPGDESLQVKVDGQRLRQVMNNLLSNAAKFSPPQSTVTISVAAGEGGVRVVVQDQGQGVPPAFGARIFQRFAQADASDTRQKGGTGLGLAISKELIERMGGEIGYHSTLGEGSSFYFVLPCCGDA